MSSILASWAQLAPLPELIRAGRWRGGASLSGHVQAPLLQGCRALYCLRSKSGVLHTVRELGEQTSDERLSQEKPSLDIRGQRRLRCRADVYCSACA